MPTEHERRQAEKDKERADWNAKNSKSRRQRLQEAYYQHRGSLQPRTPQDPQPNGR